LQDRRLLNARGIASGLVTDRAMEATFFAALRKQDGIASRALEFLILTATRTGETLGAAWNEVDMGAKLWTIPAGRMKAGKEHRVPLSDAALALLQQMHDIRHSDYVFPTWRGPDRLDRRGAAGATTGKDSSAVQTLQDRSKRRAKLAKIGVQLAFDHVPGLQLQPALPPPKVGRKPTWKTGLGDKLVRAVQDMKSQKRMRIEDAIDKLQEDKSVMWGR
jgi:integrase